MIIVSGIASEDPVSLVIESARKEGVEHFVFNQREALHYDLNAFACNSLKSFFLYAGGQKIDLNKVSGIYFRMLDSYNLPENRSKSLIQLNEKDRRKLNFVNDLFINLCDIISCRVMNRPNDMNSNFSKLYQLKVIRDTGFKIPPTLITNQRKEVDLFEEEHKQLIFKSVSSERSVVKPLDNDSKTRMNNLRFLPTQFQKCLVGYNIRVHVVGDAVFATKIQSETIDYRYSGNNGKENKMTEYELPEAVKSKCIMLSKALSLPLCGIDLFKTRRDGYYCFEVNPSPGYSYYQNHTGQDISGAIVRYLQYGTARHI